MGYLNRMVLQNATTIDGQPFDMDRSAQIGRTLHPFYTVLKNEFVFQPPPGQPEGHASLKGYWTRNFFNNNENETFSQLFGVHFAGPVKPWMQPPYHEWGARLAHP